MVKGENYVKIKKMINWKTEKRKLNELRPWERNPRQATEKQWQDLEKSLEKFSLADPLIINKDNTIIGGHFRWKVLKEKGIEEVDVRVPDRQLSEKEVEELNVRLNKNLGEWDYDLLANFDEDLLKGIGFEDEELDEIFGIEADDEFDAEKEFEKSVKNPRGVKEGDVWQLGEHRMIVGDSTKRENWEKLLGSERFDFMFTDPPYRIGYGIGVRKQKTKEGFKVQRFREYPSIGKTRRNGKALDISESPLKSMNKYFGAKKSKGGVPEFDEWLSIANEFQNPKGANVMIFENWKNVHDLWEAIEKYWKIKNMIIWYLPNRHQGFSAKYKFFSKYDIAPLAGEGVLNEEYEEELENYLKEKGQKLLDTYEVILYGNQGKSEWGRKKGSKWGRVADHITWTAVTEKASGQNIIFGTKPIQILVPYLKVLSPRNGIVMEPFGGSGSTLIACEIMKRRARLIEIEPLYAEVILARWEKFTGKEAKLLRDF